jgi:hypothetical protein
VSRPGKGEGSLHLYHCSIWVWTGCDLELSSFEMPVQVQANKSNGTVDVAPSSRNQSEAAEAAARLAGVDYAGLDLIRADRLVSHKLSTATLLLRTAM